MAAAFDWPVTQGARLTAVLPDGAPRHVGQSWLGAIAPDTTPWVLQLAGAHPTSIDRPGAERDRFLAARGGGIKSALIQAASGEDDKFFTSFSIDNLAYQLDAPISVEPTSWSRVKALYR